MTTAPAFVTRTIPLTSATGAAVNVKAALMPNGAVVVAHAFVDSAGNMLDPAKDSTVQAAIAAIGAAIAALPPVS